MSDVLSLLPRAGRAFFDRFKTPSPIQDAGIPKVAAGEHVLLCAPTATGKTETWAAPLAERLLGEGGDDLAVLVLSPTRALANDLTRRLEPPLARLGITLGRYTGEWKEWHDGRLPRVVVSTPEALDSLLARRSHTLRSLRAIVMDEIHVIDGTPRGDQLRLLLHRLDAVTALRPQRVAASATVDDPEGLASRYLRSAAVVRRSADRIFETRSFSGRAPEDFVLHVRFLAEAGFRKILVFCNRRNDVEAIAHGLRDQTQFGDRVFAHHGSLSQTVREHAERSFLEAPAAVAVATMTLELGIDIGSIDYVLLNGPPPDVSALLQRVGRGNRREGRLRFGRAVDTPWEDVVFKTMIRAAIAGEMLDADYAFRPGVLAQQALVLAGSTGSVARADVAAVLPPELRAEAHERRIEALLASMQEARLLEPPIGGRFALSASAEQRYASGRLHSNIDDEEAIEVIDRLTGEVIGTVDPDQEPRRGEEFQLGGRARSVVHEDSGKILVEARGEALPARFKSRPPPPMAFPLAQRLGKEIGLDSGEIAVVARLAPGIRIVHAMGTIGGMLLVEAFRRRHGANSVLDAGPLAFKADQLPAAPIRPTREDALAFARRHEKKLARALAMGPFHSTLPEEWRVAAIIQTSGLDKIVEHLGVARWTTREPETLCTEFCGV